MNDKVISICRSGRDHGSDEESLHIFAFPPGFGRFFRTWLSGRYQCRIHVYENKICVSLLTQKRPQGMQFDSAINHLCQKGWERRSAKHDDLIFVHEAHRVVLECDYGSTHLTICATDEGFRREIADINIYFPNSTVLASL